MPGLIAAIVVWANRERATVMVGVLCLALASMMGVWRLSFDADILNLLPQGGRVIPAFREFLARFGTLDQLYVVFTAGDGQTIDEYDEEIAAWVEQLRLAPEIIAVDVGGIDFTRDFGWLASRQLLLFRGAALGEALQRLSWDGLTIQVSRTRELLTIPSPEITELARQDPAGLLALLRETSGSVGQGSTTALSGYVTADGRSRVVIARPARPPFDSEFSRALFRRLNTIETSLQADLLTSESRDEPPRSPLRVEFGGGHRVAVETEALVRRESILNAFGSLLVILPLLFLVFRSAWLVAVGALPAALSLLVVLGGFGFLGSRLSAAGTGASAMLFGLGIDGVVLLYVAYLCPVVGGPDTSSRIAGPAASMVLGMWTTAATFYGLAFVNFPSLQQLGLLVGHSMLICGILTLVVVPALLPQRAQRDNAGGLSLPRLPRWVLAHRRAILVIAGTLTLLFGLAMTRLQVNPSVERLRSVTEAARLETTIGAAFGLSANPYVVVADGADLDTLLGANERLTESLAAALPRVRVEAPSWLLPSRAAQERAAQQIARSGLTETAVLRSLDRAITDNGFRTDAFEPFAARLPALLDTSQRLTYDDYIRHGLGDLLGRFIVREDGRWHLATYVLPNSPDDVTRIQTIVDQVDPTEILTGLPIVNHELSRTFVQEFLKGLAIGSALVIVLVATAFRSWRLCLFALLPTAVALVWTGGILALAGIELDLFSAFAIVTLLGIGVDYGVHLIHRYREKGDATAATAELAPVILVAAAITILGYGTLVTSSYPPLRSIGVVSVVSVVALAAATMLVLPALLLKPLPASDGG